MRMAFMLIREYANRRLLFVILAYLCHSHKFAYSYHFLIAVKKIEDILKHMLVFDIGNEGMIGFFDIYLLFDFGTDFFINFFQTMPANDMIRG